MPLPALATSAVYVVSLVLGICSVAILARRVAVVAKMKAIGPLGVSGILVFAAMFFAGMMLLKSSESFVSPEALAGVMLVAVSLGVYALVVEITYRKSRKSDIR